MKEKNINEGGEVDSKLRNTFLLDNVRKAYNFFRIVRIRDVRILLVPTLNSSEPNLFFCQLAAHLEKQKKYKTIMFFQYCLPALCLWCRWRLEEIRM